MSKETRRTRQSRELEQDILAEASQRLAEGGPAAVTLRGVAREVGVSAAALYTYFPSLAELFTELIVQSYTALANSVTAALHSARGANLEERLEAGPVAYRHWAVQHRHQFNLVFFDQVTGYVAPPDGPTVEAQTRVLQPIAAQYAEALDRSIDDMWRDDDLLDDFLGWWGAFHGIIALEVNHHLDWRDPEAIFLSHLRSSIQHLLTPAVTTIK